MLSVRDKHSHYHMLLLHVCKAAGPAGLASYACAGVHVTQLDVF